MCSRSEATEEKRSFFEAAPFETNNKGMMMRKERSEATEEKRSFFEAAPFEINNRRLK